MVISKMVYPLIGLKTKSVEAFAYPVLVTPEEIPLGFAARMSNAVS